MTRVNNFTYDPSKLMLNFRGDGAGAYTQSIISRIKSAPHVFDYIDPRWHAKILNYEFSTDLGPYLVNAHNTFSNSGILVYPQGLFPFNGELPLRYSNSTLIGAGAGTTQLVPLQTTSNGLNIRPIASGATDYIFRVNIIGITIFSGATNPTAGSMLRMERVSEFNINGCEVGGGYGGLEIISSNQGRIDIAIQGGSNMTARAVDSFLFKASKVVGGQHPNELHFNTAEWRGRGAGFIDHSILYTALDGNFFDNMHIGFTRYGISLMPETDATQLTGLKGTFWIDTCGEANVYFKRPSASYDGYFGLHEINLVDVYDSKTGFLCDCAALTAANNLDTNINRGNWHAFDNDAIRIILGRNIHINGPKIFDVNRTGGGGSGIILTDAVGCSINEPSIKRLLGINAPTSAIDIGVACSNIVVSGHTQIVGCTEDIRAFNTASSVKIDDIQTSAASPPTVVVNGSGAAILSSGHSLFYLDLTNSMGAISASPQKGREITFIVSVAGSIFDTNNLKMAGNFVATVDDTITFRFDGTNYYETGRSVN